MKKPSPPDGATGNNPATPENPRAGAKRITYFCSGTDDAPPPATEAPAAVHPLADGVDDAPSP